MIIADNQDIARAGILYLLKELKGISIPTDIVEITNKSQLLSLLKTKETAFVIIDYTNMDFNSADELLTIHERFPQVKWLLFSDELSEEFLRRVLLDNSAFGVVMKENSGTEIQSALQYTLQGKRYICHYVTNLLLSSQPEKPKSNKSSVLTTTEKEILHEIALGKTTKEIAATRFLSFHTVNSHRKNIFRKLEVNNVHEAIKYAMRAGIIDWAEYCI